MAFSTVALEKGEDGLWYANIKFAEGVDATGFTVSATAGDATYLYTELGVKPYLLFLHTLHQDTCSGFLILPLEGMEKKGR